MSPQEAVDALNRWLAIDPAVVTRIMNTRHKVAADARERFTDDPTLIVGGTSDDDMTLGPLGIVNGLLCHGSQRIAAVYEGKGPGNTPEADKARGRILRFEIFEARKA